MDLIKPPARKGKKNRVSLNCRIDEVTLNTILYIVEELKISRGQAIDMLAMDWVKESGRSTKVTK